MVTSRGRKRLRNAWGWSRRYGREDDPASGRSKFVPSPFCRGNLRQIDSPGLTGEGQADHHREEAEPMHRHLCPEAELVILSRKRIDNNGPESACQSANFQMAQWVRTIS